MAELLTIGPASAVADGVLVKDEATGEHYIVSTANRWSGESETIVFAAAADGEYEDRVVAGGTGMTREDALADLSARIDEGRLWTDEENAEFQRRDEEEFFAALFGSDVPV